VADLIPIPYKAIADAALSSAETLVSRWLPGGKKKNNEYFVCNPLRADSKPNSFAINLVKGEWGDFATNDAGKDLISLYAYLEGIEQWKAAIDVADQIGFNLPEGCRPKTKQAKPRQKPVIDPETVKQAKPKEESPWHPVTPVPANAEDAPLAHPNRGLPAMKWAYKDANGQLLGYVYRFNTSDGGKETLPLTYCKYSKNNHYEWRWMQWPEPNRPLYGLDRLKAKPDAYVILVEGEKCADAPVELLPKAAIVTWSGGSKAIDKSNWEALAGRTIYAWPDCDAQRVKLTKAEAEQGVDPKSKTLLPECEQPGVKAMLKIKEKLLALNPATVFKMVSIPKPESVPGGWDIADAIDSGWSDTRLREFILNTRDYEQIAVPADTSKSISTPNSANAEVDSMAWTVGLMTTDKGKVLDCRENVFLYVNNHPELVGMVAYDEFALRIIKRKPAPWDIPFDGDAEWSDNDSLELALWLAQQYDLPIRSMDSINHAIKLAASRNAFDPLLEYLDGLVWDKTPRIQSWLTDYAGVESTEYSALAGRLFLISMIARAYKPGCIMRAMPVFEGQQFRGKSSIARILAGEWFSDSPLDLKGKDGFINIQGTWLHEIAELGSFNNQEAPIIKAYLSSASDRFRSPFDKYAKDYPRRTVFFGTTNEDIYLRDKTGNSRFWPLRTEAVSDINLDGLTQARDQLFAEAVALYKAGERWHPLADEQIRLFVPEQTLREYDDPWEGRIEDWLHLETFSSTSVSDVLSNCLKIESGKQTQANAIQVGKILTRLGWKKERPGATRDEKRRRAYVRPVDQAMQSTIQDEDDDPIPF
jgi:predicted P-loop ATPase